MVPNNASFPEFEQKLAIIRYVHARWTSTDWNYKLPLFLGIDALRYCRFLCDFGRFSEGSERLQRFSKEFQNVMKIT